MQHMGFRHSGRRIRLFRHKVRMLHQALHLPQIASELCILQFSYLQIKRFPGAHQPDAQFPSSFSREALFPVLLFASIRVIRGQSFSSFCIVNSSFVSRPLVAPKSTKAN
jgi:hypothetical protein